MQCILNETIIVIAFVFEVLHSICIVNRPVTPTCPCPISANQNMTLSMLPTRHEETPTSSLNASYHLAATQGLHPTRPLASPQARLRPGRGEVGTCLGIVNWRGEGQRGGGRRPIWTVSGPCEQIRPYSFATTALFGEPLHNHCPPPQLPSPPPEDSRRVTSRATLSQSRRVVALIRCSTYTMRPHQYKSY